MTTYASTLKAVPRKTYTPIGCLVALHVYDVRETEAGILLPDGVQSPTATPEALVIAVGPECKWVKEGQTVLALNSQPARIVYHKGQKTVLLREENLVGIVDNP